MLIGTLLSTLFSPSETEQARAACETVYAFPHYLVLLKPVDELCVDVDAENGFPHYLVLLKLTFLFIIALAIYAFHTI